MARLSFAEAPHFDRRARSRQLVAAVVPTESGRADSQQIGALRGRLGHERQRPEN